MLLGCDPVTGRPRIPPDVLKAAVVGGLLADLFLSGRLYLADGGVHAGQDRIVPVPRVQRIACDRVRARPGRDIGFWVGHLDPVPGLVVAGLVRSGFLRQVRVRCAGSWWRRSWALAPAGPAFCRARVRGLGMILARSEPLTDRTLALAGLVDAAGLLPVVVHAAGITTVTDRSTIVPVRARIRHAFHHTATPDLALVCAAVTATTGPDTVLPA